LTLTPRISIARRIIVTAALAASVLAIGVPAASEAHTATAVAGDSHNTVKNDLRKARRATQAFRDVAAARAAGYEADHECVEDPKYGAMGIHYSNPRLIADGRLDVERPEVLVYQPTRGGKLRLGAIEYFQADADQDLDTDDDRPSMFGLPFDGPMLGHNPQMPKHYDLHVWLYRHNPAGMFAMWNPRVKCPGDHAGGH
jgi:hypothetical protein